MNRVEVNLAGLTGESWHDRTVPFVKAVLERLGRRGWDLSLLFCDRAYIQSLNARYRNRDEPTDVLSFALGRPPENGAPGRPFGPSAGAGGRFTAGDIVICPEEAWENAAYFKVPPGEELRRLLIHGILHLDGMDHAGKLAGEGEGSAPPEPAPVDPMLVLQEELVKEFADMRVLDEEDR
ncbi:MAG: rRNA maturation RNase YbeY [Treponema sp.]|jgi:probable rRNA maturation factor|nr:rRNA maturation RNase YbeY [Treponema sp.]